MRIMMITGLMILLFCDVTYAQEEQKAKGESLPVAAEQSVTTPALEGEKAISGQSVESQTEEKKATEEKNPTEITARSSENEAQDNSATAATSENVEAVEKKEPTAVMIARLPENESKNDSEPAVELEDSYDIEKEPMVALEPEEEVTAVGHIEAPALKQQSIEQEEPAGIDTVSLEDPQGNWLFKKIWWERAEERYGKIRDLVTSIWESRTTFFVQRNELDKKVLDPFYISLGMGQGELQLILSELEEFFNKEREEQGDLSEKERALYETLEGEQEAFKQLKLDVESISNLDKAIDDALGILMDQINKARQLEKQAWENFKEIAHVLSDMKARDLYYMMDGAGRNIKNISIYFEKDFANHFNRLITETKKHTTRVLDHIKALKEKGVDFKRQVDRLAQQEEQEKAAKAAQEAEEAEAAAHKAKQKKQQGWGDWALSLPGAAWDTVSSWASETYNYFFGKKK